MRNSLIKMSLAISLFCGAMPAYAAESDSIGQMIGVGTNAASPVVAIHAPVAAPVIYPQVSPVYSRAPAHPASSNAFSSTYSPAATNGTINLQGDEALIVNQAAAVRDHKQMEGTLAAGLLLGVAMASYGFILIVISLVSPRPWARICVGLSLIIVAAVYSGLLFGAIRSTNQFPISCGGF